MLRTLGGFLLPAVLLLSEPASASAQLVPMGPGGQAMMGPNLQGRYINPENGEFCYVRWMGRRRYLFIDEAGVRMAFAPTSPSTLRAVPLGRVQPPFVTVTVTGNGQGGRTLRFEAAGPIAGYWLSTP
jgi:hypothetical protein